LDFIKDDRIIGQFELDSKIGFAKVFFEVEGDLPEKVVE